MTGINWAVLCDLAYFDTYGNLCTIGIHTGGPVRVLPAGVRRLSIAARLADVRPAEPLDVVLSISTPHGPSTESDGFEGVRTEVNAECLVLSIGRAPLLQEGVYRFEVSIGPASVDIPLLVSGHA